jgi:hypothetical protein
MYFWKACRSKANVDRTAGSTTSLHVFPDFRNAPLQNGTSVHAGTPQLTPITFDEMSVLAARLQVN